MNIEERNKDRANLLLGDMLSYLENSKDEIDEIKTLLENKKTIDINNSINVSSRNDGKDPVLNKPGFSNNSNAPKNRLIIKDKNFKDYTDKDAFYALADPSTAKKLPRTETSKRTRTSKVAGAIAGGLLGLITGIPHTFISSYRETILEFSKRIEQRDKIKRTKVGHLSISIPTGVNVPWAITCAIFGCLVLNPIKTAFGFIIGAVEGVKLGYQGGFYQGIKSCHDWKPPSLKTVAQRADQYTKDHPDGFTVTINHSNLNPLNGSSPLEGAVIGTTTFSHSRREILRKLQAKILSNGPSNEAKILHTYHFYRSIVENGTYKGETCQALENTLVHLLGIDTNEFQQAKKERDKIFRMGNNNPVFDLIAREVAAQLWGKQPLSVKSRYTNSVIFERFCELEKERGGFSYNSNLLFKRKHSASMTGIETKIENAVNLIDGKYILQG